MAAPGPRNSLTDVAGLRVGCAEDAHAGTGVTVVLTDAAALCAVEVLGGGPGTRETDVLAPHNLVGAVDALVFSGGSVYGLGAADAVAAALGAAGRGFQLVARPETPRSPIVPAAILYDLANGANKAWGESPPYARLGREALSRAGLEVALGNAGAGYGAAAGALKGGQGSASIVSATGITVAALACVNSFGSPLMPDSRVFWAWPFEIGAEFGGVRPDPRAPAPDPERWGAARSDPGAPASTTLAVVATDAEITRTEAKRIAQMAAAGLARAIRPVFAPSDGDVVFALSTCAKPLAEPRTQMIARLGALGADCLARAVARGVYEARALHGRPGWRDLSG